MQEGTYAFGYTSEHYIILEIIRLSLYRNNDWSFSYLHTRDNAKIDLIIDRPGLPTALIEIKSKKYITKRDVNNINRFSDDFSSSEAFCISRDPHKKKIGSVKCFPWKQALIKIGL